MSGFEVVGVLLGAFPLAISALEHYRETCKTLGLMNNFMTEWKKTFDDIKDEEVLLRMTLQTLILPLANDLAEDDLDELIADPGNEKWADQDIETALQQRLGVAHARFFEIARDLQNLVFKLLRIIGVDKPSIKAKLNEDTTNVGSGDSPKRQLKAIALGKAIARNVEYRTEQLKFGFGRPQRDELLLEIRAKREKLDLFLEKSGKVASYQQARTVAVSPKTVKSLLVYWKHADRVYRLIRQSWGCKCQTRHCAHLWLQHQTSTTFEFKLLVLWSPPLDQNLPAWQPQGLKITYAAGSFFRAPPRRVVDVSEQQQSVSKAKGAKKQRLSGGSGVRFELPSSSATSDGVDVERAADASEIAAMNIRQEISRLCAAMGACGMQPTCIGSLTDAEQGESYQVFSQPDQKIAASEINLHQILAKQTDNPVSRSERFQIALAVASSHLQLRSTSWARRQWESTDIRFPKSAGQCSSIMFDRPYISADFNSVLQDHQKNVAKTVRSFACLGIMLLELLFGMRLEDHDLWRRFVENGMEKTEKSWNLRLMVAKDWAESVQGEAGDDFAAAVSWCLNDSPSTLDGDDWRDRLAEKVVLPLQTCCNWIKTVPST